MKTLSEKCAERKAERKDAKRLRKNAKAQQLRNTGMIRRMTNRLCNINAMSAVDRLPPKASFALQQQVIREAWE